jgi:sporadic carbohydrate cluster 2OG-Fe(II) oxygenase
MSFIKEGLSIVKVRNLDFLNLLKKTVCDNLNTDDLVNLHRNVSIDNINQYRLQSFQAINKLNNWDKEYYSLIENDIDKILGPDILIQRKLNLSIQMPHDPTSILSMHSDTLSGQSPFEIVVWLPITTAYDTNAMFYFDIDTSHQIRLEMIKYENLGLDFLRDKFWHKRKILNIKEGEIAFFSSTIFHGNVLNETSHTRISINCRFKNLYSPETSIEPNERGVGMFYKLLKTSPVTDIAMNYINYEDMFL